METKVLKVDGNQIDADLINKAAEVIKQGGLVAFPTETVYGLGADALNSEAVKKIFAAKGRPLYDPLIVHIADKEDLLLLAREVYKVALDLADAFWPGPMTLVLKKSASIPDIVTSGLETVAIRMPDNPVALSLIRESNTPIAAPSANLFGRTSPVSAEHVLQDLNGKIDLILDAGRVRIGVESTILDLTQTPFRVLRPGGVSLEALRTIISDVELYQGNSVLSPGMLKRHYAPKARLILAGGKGKEEVENVKNLAYEFIMQGYSVGIMVKDEHKNSYSSDFNLKVLGSERNLASCAANLYSVLREFDREGVQIIISESIKEEGLGVAIMDRLIRAAGKDKGVQ